MPKVSVIIPTYNRATLLPAAVESVLRQSFQDFEIIVVDDASQDGTLDVIRTFTDRRIHHIRHDAHKGQGVSRNAGIRNAFGEYIAFLDDDDEWLPEKLEKQVFLLDSSPPKVGMVYTGFREIAASTKEVIAEVIPERRGYLFEQMCIRNWIGTCSTVLLRRSCFENTGLFDEGLASGADYDLWLRVSKEFDIEYILEPLVLYTVHAHRISTNRESLIRGMEAQLKKNAAIFSTSTKSYSQRYLFLGVHYCYLGDLRKGREAFAKAIRLYPFEIRYYYNLCLSLLGVDTFRKMKDFRDNRLSKRKFESGRRPINQ